MAGTPEQAPRFFTKVVVMQKLEFFDPKGEALAGAARRLGIPVKSIREGKVFQITQDAEDERAANEKAKELGRKLLANPVIEDVPEAEIKSIQGGDLYKTTEGNVPHPRAYEENEIKPLKLS